MRAAHPGCGGHAGSRGYNSGGHYCGGWAGNCGDGGVGGSSWYLICEKCRATYMARSRQPMDIDAKNRANLKITQQPLQSASLRKKSFTLAAAASAATASQINSHIIMTNNAMFLLDLASASNSNLANLTAKGKASQSTSVLSSVSELGGK